MSIITPTGDPEIDLRGYGYGKKFPDGTISYMTDAEASAFQARLRSLVLSELARRSSIFGPSSVPYRLRPDFPKWECSGGFKYSDGDSGPPRPDPINSSSNFKVKTKNPNFLSRKQQGDIVLAPYAVVDITLSVEPVAVRKEEPGPIQYVHIAAMADLYTWEQNWAYFPALGCYIEFVGGRMQRVPCNISMIVAWSDPAWFPVKSASHYIPRDQVLLDSLISATQAKATRGAIDALTAVSEIPKGVLSVLDTLVELKKGLKRFKTTELALSKAHSIRKISISRDKDTALKHLSISYRQEIEIANAIEKPSKRRYELRKALRRYSKERKHIVKRFKDADIQAQKELISGVSSAWLRVRYEVMPVLYTMEDLLDYKNESGATFLTYRGKDHPRVVLPQYPGWELMEVWNVEHKCMIKVKVENPSDLHNRLVYTNILYTAWELVPYSFVVEWFLNIGDWITNTFSILPNIGSGNTYSFKHQGRALYVHTETGMQAVINMNCYDRTIINPCDYTELNLSFDINAKRTIDSIALIWGKVKYQ